MSMLNHQMFNPQPNYSGVTIQIANPAVNVNPYGTNCSQNGFRLNNNGDSVVPLNPYYQGVRGENLNPALYSDQYLGNNSSAIPDKII